MISKLANALLCANKRSVLIAFNVVEYIAAVVANLSALNVLVVQALIKLKL